MNKYRNDSLFKSIYILGGIFELIWIISLVFVGLKQPFDYWWILIIVFIIRNILNIFHLIIGIKLKNNDNGNFPAYLTITILNLFLLNPFFFTMSLFWITKNRKNKLFD